VVISLSRSAGVEGGDASMFCVMRSLSGGSNGGGDVLVR
jgi:hypothetical protein